MGILALMLACASSTRITGSWKNPSYPKRTYDRIFVAAMTGDKVTRSAIENHLQQSLLKVGLNSVKSMDELPPGFRRDSLMKNEILNRVKNSGIPAIITISVLRKETESRYVSGGYLPGSRFGYYNTFGGYYRYWAPLYDPGYYVNEDVYYFETNLYDSETETLVWSAQSETYLYGNIQAFSNEFAAITVEQLMKDGLINRKDKT
jgi:hypothetical protein